MGRWLLLTVGLLAVMAAPAGAASAIKPLSPKAGTTVALGKSPTFRARVHGSGQVWVRVCGSRRTTHGLICATDSIGRAKRGKSAIYTYKPRFYDFADFWLNRPGTYYWQAYRIACKRSRCRQPGPIVAFKVG
jgi:hypothetical protein